MKKILILILISASAAFASESIKGAVQKNTVFDYMEALNLSPAQRKQILRIRNEETLNLRPIVLDITSKEEGLDYLYNLRCDIFDFECKSKLKKDILDKENEKAELVRKINQKRAYYEIRYKNVLSREQMLKLDKMIKDDKHKTLVIKERQERAKKQQRIEKLKFWNKFKKKSSS